MENNLSKAISQIKRPVRYDEESTEIRDANNEHAITVWGSLWQFESNLSHAFGHALAEMINGLDGRGNLQEGDDFKGFDIPPPDFVATPEEELNHMDWVYVPQAVFTSGGREHNIFQYDSRINYSLYFGAEMTFYRIMPRKEAPDRQVKSAEDVFQSKNGGKDSDTSVEHGETFTAKFVIDFAESYAQQYK